MRATLWKGLLVGSLSSLLAVLSVLYLSSGFPSQPACVSQVENDQAVNLAKCIQSQIAWRQAGDSYASAFWSFESRLALCIGLACALAVGVTRSRRKVLGASVLFGGLYFFALFGIVSLRPSFSGTLDWWSYRVCSAQISVYGLLALLAFGIACGGATLFWGIRGGTRFTGLALLAWTGSVLAISPSEMSIHVIDQVPDIVSNWMVMAAGFLLVAASSADRILRLRR